MMANLETNPRAPRRRNKRSRVTSSRSKRTISKRRAPHQKAMMTRRRPKVMINSSSRKVMIRRATARVNLNRIRRASHPCHRLHLADRPRLRQMCISHQQPREWLPKRAPSHPSQTVQLQLQLTPLSQSALWPLLSRTEQQRRYLVHSRKRANRSTCSYLPLNVSKKHRFTFMPLLIIILILS